MQSLTACAGQCRSGVGTLQQRAAKQAGSAHAHGLLGSDGRAEAMLAEPALGVEPPQTGPAWALGGFNQLPWLMGIVSLYFLNAGSLQVQTQPSRTHLSLTLTLLAQKAPPPPSNSKVDPPAAAFPKTGASSWVPKHMVGIFSVIRHKEQPHT